MHDTISVLAVILSIHFSSFSLQLGISFCCLSLSLSTTRCEMQLTITTNNTALFMLQHQLQCGSHMPFMYSTESSFGFYNVLSFKCSILGISPLHLFPDNQEYNSPSTYWKKSGKRKKNDFLEKLGSFGKLTFDTLIL